MLQWNSSSNLRLRTAGLALPSIARLDENFAPSELSRQRRAVLDKQAAMLDGLRSFLVASPDRSGAHNGALVI
jgi:hypothetical protein